jgi:hypothetical protein
VCASPGPVLFWPAGLPSRPRLSRCPCLLLQVLLQNYQNPHVQLFVSELQRRLPPQRDPHTLDLPSPPPRSLSPPPPLPRPSSDTGADYLPRSGALPWQQAGPAPERGPLSESLLLAPGLTAHLAPLGQGAQAVAQAAVGMEAQAGRGKSPLGRGGDSGAGPSGEARARRMEARWRDLQRENSLRGRSWSPVRRPAPEGPKRSPRGTTHSPARGGSRERVRSLSPARGLPQEAPPGGARGAYSAYVGAEGRGSRGASPGLQRGRSPAPLQKPARWAPLAALKEALLGRKKAYQRIVVSPDSESRHPSPMPSSQVLYLEGGPEGGGPPFAAQGGSAPVVLPFEFRCLEVILETVCGHLEVKSGELEAEAYPALDDLTVKISAANLERVRRFKSRLVGLSVRVQKVRPPAHAPPRGGKAKGRGEMPPAFGSPACSGSRWQGWAGMGCSPQGHDQRRAAQAWQNHC